MTLVLLMAAAASLSLASAPPADGLGQDAAAGPSSVQESAPLTAPRGASLSRADPATDTFGRGRCDDVRVRRRAFDHGELEARECAVRLLRADLRDPGESNYLNIRDHADLLRGYYERRAERQQTFMDGLSLVTVGGAAGAFEGNISPALQTAWIITAVVPSVVSRFNAYEPTRELFQGGAVAIHLMTVRQDRIHRGRDLLATEFKIDCGVIASELATVRRARTAPPALPARATASQRASHAQAATSAAAYDPDGVLLAEARRLDSICTDLSRRSAGLDAAVTELKGLSKVLAGDYAADVLSLDHALVAKDRELRFSPLETLSAVAATPFRTLDMLITGQDTQAALDTLKTQIAFAGMNRTLAAIPLPSWTPTGAAALTPVAPLSSAALAMDTAKAGEALSTNITGLRGAAEELIRNQARLAYRERLAADLFGAAAATNLAFSFDPATSTTVVTLGPPPAPPTMVGPSIR